MQFNVTKNYDPSETLYLLKISHADLVNAKGPELLRVIFSLSTSGSISDKLLVLYDLAKRIEKGNTPKGSLNAHFSIMAFLRTHFHRFIQKNPG